MSLLDEAMVDCVIYNKSIEADEYGGYITNWTEGARFKAAVVYSNSIQARIAEKQGVTDLYTVTVKKAMKLEYHDVFKRLSDNKVFRVTSDGDDNHTPISANLDMRQVSAEEWSLSSE